MVFKYYLLLSTAFLSFSGCCSSPTEFEIISRSDWGAMAPRGNYSKLVILPAPLVVIGHTVSGSCSDRTSCAKVLRAIQESHLSSILTVDIAYHFLVGGDGAVYEGRGWDVQGAHTWGVNNRSICFSFVGNYNQLEPSAKQMEVLQKILDSGIESNKLAKDYKLFGQCQIRPTQSPGDKLYSKIQKLKHWTPDSQHPCRFKL